MAKKKTVKISDINKEIVEEIKAEEIANKIPGVISDVTDALKVTSSINKLDDSINSLLNITQMLDKRIDMLRGDYDILKSRVNRLDGR